PREVLGVGNVLASSKDLYVHDTGKLLVKFVDVPFIKQAADAAPPKKPDNRPAATPVPTKEIQPRQPQQMPKGPEKTVVTATPASRQGAAGPVLPAAEEKPPQKPFDLSARQVEAKIQRSPDNKNALDELWCQGQVKIFQEPAKPDEKGTKI